MTRIENIGNRHGRICLWLDKEEAINMAEHYGSYDSFYDDLMEAVKLAYPEEVVEDEN